VPREQLRASERREDGRARAEMPLARGRGRAGSREFGREREPRRDTGRERGFARREDAAPSDSRNIDRGRDAGRDRPRGFAGRDADDSRNIDRGRDAGRPRGFESRVDDAPTQEWTPRKKDLPWVQDIQSKAFAERTARRSAAASSAVKEPAPAPTLSTQSDIDPTAVSSVSTDDLPTSFTSPPLLPGFAKSVTELLGPDARPTAIQALALKHLLGDGAPTSALLASETGSGKSLAYLLPLLQALKRAEPAFVPAQSDRAVNPRALVLAPTHELARQLAGFAKALSHVEKARVQCASRANGASTGGARGGTAAQFARAFEGGEFVQRHEPRALDVLVATPAKALDMVRGRGWAGPPKRAEGAPPDPNADKEWTVGRAEMGLANVEWVVVDEADVLFGGWARERVECVC
jgi:hypothetical protein